MISFEDPILQRACSDLEQMRKVWGAEVGLTAARRIAQLQAAPCLGDLANAPGRYRESLFGDRYRITADLAAHFVLILAPTEHPAPTGDDGQLDWTGVQRITIIDISPETGGVPTR